MSRLCDQPAYELLRMLTAGLCSSRELVEDLCRAVDEREPDVDAYLALDVDRALACAEAADAARAQGEQGRLLGLPVGIKDLINVMGEPCTCASRILEGYTAPYDATVVGRIRAEGAFPMGRLNMDEFAMGSSTENSGFKPTRNPWNVDCVPGGSSGGPAAAVAAGECCMALGTDTGGSIRQPASFCGCVGLKPSYGRVSRYGLTAYASSLDQIGPVTRNVRDAALLLSVIAGHDKLDSTCLDRAVPDYEEALKSDVKGLKLGLPAEYFVDGLDPQVDAAVHAAIEVCRKAGAEIVDLSLPHTRYAIAAYYIIATAEASANLARFDGVRYGARVPDAVDPLEMYRRTRAQGFGQEVKRRIILGTYVLSSGYYDAYYLRAQKVRTLIRADFERAFEQCDAILTPVVPTPAYRLGEKTGDPLEMYLSDIFTVPANLAGVCGVSVPCGFASESRPIGLHIIGPAFGEDTVLRIAYAYEQATEWHARRPAFHGRVTGTDGTHD